MVSDQQDFEMYKVFIGIPTHNGSVDGGTLVSISHAQKSVLAKVDYQTLGLSLLARCFNSLFITAVERGADYFILLHADINITGCAVQQRSWVDYLISQATMKNAAVVSALSPIKTPQGHFSAGLDLHYGNYQALRRLTVREAEELPEMISREDMCKVFKADPSTAGAMLINTGCMLMDLKRFDWTMWPGFMIWDTIAWGKSGRPRAFTRSEDWQFSRWLFENNYPYYNTRGLALEHIGRQVYPNHGHQGLWGDPVDFMDRDILPSEWETTE